MKTLIVGLGSIGKRHLRNLKQIDPGGEVIVLRQHARPGSSEPLPEGIDGVYYSLEDALATRPEAAFITNPASLHIQTAASLACQGVHLMVEKPLSDRLEGVPELVQLCGQKQLVLMVAYNFRFYRPLQQLKEALDSGLIGRVLSVRSEVGQYLPDWRPGGDYRTNVSARKELGGGAVLELSHEIDYTRWLVGEISRVSAFVRRVSDLEIDVEDTAEIVFECANGVVGSIHLDFLQRPARRQCVIIGSNGTALWDAIQHRLDYYDLASKAWNAICDLGPADYQEMYLAEIRHFIDCVKNGKKPVVDGQDGLRTLQTVLAVKRSSELKQAVEIS